MNISDEAVEAAARDIFQVAADFAYEDGSWDEMAEESRREFRDDARRILTAAAPHLMAQALEEAADLAHDRAAGLDGSEARESENRGYMQRHNVSSAARWLRARADAYRAAGAGE